MVQVWSVGFAAPSLLAITLIQLTGPDKQIIEINPEQIVSIRNPRPGTTEHFSPNIHCIILTTDGKLITVIEECSVVRDMIAGNK